MTDEFDGHLDSSRLTRDEVDVVAQRFCISLADWVLLLQVYGTADRLAAYLRYRKRALGPGGSYVPPSDPDQSTLDVRNATDPRIVRASHGELAQLLGASREKTTLAVAKLRKLGWVAVGRGYVEWLR